MREQLWTTPKRENPHWVKKKPFPAYLPTPHLRHTHGATLTRHVRETRWLFSAIVSTDFEAVTTRRGGVYRNPVSNSLKTPQIPSELLSFPQQPFSRHGSASFTLLVTFFYTFVFLPSWSRRILDAFLSLHCSRRYYASCFGVGDGWAEIAAVYEVVLKPSPRNLLGSVMTKVGNKNCVKCLRQNGKCLEVSETWPRRRRRVTGLDARRVGWGREARCSGVGGSLTLSMTMQSRKTFCGQRTKPESGN